MMTNGAIEDGAKNSVKSMGKKQGLPCGENVQQGKNTCENTLGSVQTLELNAGTRCTCAILHDMQMNH